MNFKPIYARIGISATTRIVLRRLLLFFLGLILFTRLATFNQPASAINFAKDGVRPLDALNYESLGYVYDSLPIQGSNTNLKVRKNAASLTPNEINRFVNAVKSLKNTTTSGRDGTQISIYDQFVATHLATSDIAGRLGPDGQPFASPAHGNSAFLPWHRNLLLEFETLLQVVDPSVTLPYWDFTNSSDTGNIIFKDNFIGPNGGSGGVGGGTVLSGFFTQANGWVQRKDLSYNRWSGKSTATQPLTRSLQSLSNLPTSTKVDRILANTSYPDFRNALENFLHNGVHGWVGGSLKTLGTSPNDPVFWLLHTNVDRIWAQWQVNGHWGSDWYPASGQPYGHNLNDLMWPWDLGQMSAAADLQALVPSAGSAQAIKAPSQSVRRFKVAKNPQELLSNETHLYNPFVNDEHQLMAHQMSDDEDTNHISNSSSSTS